MLAEQGPVFVTLKIAPVRPQQRDYNRIHGLEVRQAFKHAIKSG